MRITKCRATALAIGLLFLVSCTKNTQDVKAALDSHPEWLVEVMQKNPEKFAQALQTVEQEAQKIQQKKTQEAERAQQDEEFKNPKVAAIGADRATLGKKDAPITLVEYSDFQCPYCQRGYNTVREVQKKYGDKILFVYKNTPLPFHPMAMPAAKRFEAIAMQSIDKAFAYHNAVFEGQNRLNAEGEKFLDEVAKKVGVNMAKMKKDMDGPEVKARIDGDMAEAQKFQFSGTPGFLVAGVSLKGAYPLNAFEAIIDRKLAEKGGNRAAASAPAAAAPAEAAAAPTAVAPTPAAGAAAK